MEILGKIRNSDRGGEDRPKKGRGEGCGLALLPNPTLTHDQVKRMKRDYVVGREALELGDLGIRPILLEEVLPDCIPDW